jgi:hypothetical protein
MRKMTSQPPQRYDNTLPGIGERRHFARRRLCVDLSILPLDGRSPSQWARSEDLSSRGMLVHSAFNYPIGTSLLIHMLTSDGPLRVTAKVVHVLEGIGFGCKFDSISSTERQAFSNLLQEFGAAPRVSA